MVYVFAASNIYKSSNLTSWLYRPTDVSLSIAFVTNFILLITVEKFCESVKI